MVRLELPIVEVAPSAPEGRTIAELVNSTTQFTDLEPYLGETLDQFAAALGAIRPVRCGVWHEEVLARFSDCPMRPSNINCCHQRTIDAGGEYAARRLRAAVELAELLGKPLPAVHLTMMAISHSVHQLYAIDDQAIAAYSPFYDYLPQQDMPHEEEAKLQTHRRHLQESAAREAEPMIEAAAVLVSWYRQNILPEYPVSA